MVIKNGFLKGELYKANGCLLSESNSSIISTTVELPLELSHHDITDVKSDHISWILNFKVMGPMFHSKLSEIHCEK